MIDNPENERLIGDIRKVQQQMNEAEAQGNKEDYQKLHDQKSALKKRLPAWLFCTGKIEESEKTVFGKPMKAAWRKSEKAYLNGLCMLDIDGLKEPREAFRAVVEKWLGFAENREMEEMLFGKDGAMSWCGTFCRAHGILLVHVTPSGEGLRFVFKADASRGNLADNQLWLAGILGMKLDGVCKDSVRISFCCTREDIIYVELEELLNYENEEFDKSFGEDYRLGNSDATDGLHHRMGISGRTDHGNNGKEDDTTKATDVRSDGTADHGSALTAEEIKEIVTDGYRGVAFHKICDEWMQKEFGGSPKVGERNAAYYSLVQGCLRYICEFNEDLVVAAAPAYGLSEQERRQCAKSAIGARRYTSMPKQLVLFLEGLGVVFSENALKENNAREDTFGGWPFEAWASRFDPWFESKVWAPVCSILPRYSRLNGMLTAASMFGTLLSGCRLRNWYDGSDLCLTYMTYIIGDAGTGKGDYREIDRLIMEPLRQADERGRKAEESYQTEIKRLSMAKVKKDDIPEERHFPVRYLPTDSTLKQKLERCMDANISFGNELRQVACYNFESELSSKLNYEKNSWNSSQDFDKKSFDCELTGSESRSSMTRNGLVPAFFNFVVTGTPDAMQRKINLRNCLDGLPTRLIMGVQYGQKYQMLKRSMRRRKVKDSDWMRTVGNRLMECGWDIDLEQQVSVPKKWRERLGTRTSFSDALYYWGQQKALALSLEDDSLGDYFRKRPPMIAVRLAVVDAILGSLESFEESGKLNLKFSSIELALNLADYIFDSQMWFFGKLIDDALTGVGVKGNVRQNTKRILAFESLKDQFTLEDVMEILKISKKTSSNYCSQLCSNGFVKRLQKGKFQKLVKIIV